jgi:hypothetical protein
LLRTVDSRPISAQTGAVSKTADENRMEFRARDHSVIQRGKNRAPSIKTDAGALLKAAKKKTKTTQLKPVIGWREWAAFPDLGVKRINAKIDTGAKTSAIHAFQIKEIPFGSKIYVEFYLHPLQRRRTPEIFCRAPIVGKRVIRSSNGEQEVRCVIQTRLRLGTSSWNIDLTLTDRDSMGFRLLIGRDAIRRKFIIDPGASYLLGDRSQ